MKNYDEAHLIQYPVGHVFSPDCFCEPFCEFVHIPGEDREMLVVRHVDWTPIQHQTILERRTQHPSWITRVLEEVKGE